jgi:hypothetical protein
MLSAAVMFSDIMLSAAVMFSDIMLSAFSAIVLGNIDNRDEA